MLCPSCQREVSAADERCIACGQILAGTITSGTLIGGRYEILIPLGRGGMGVVYKARDRVLDETVALKLLRPDVTRVQAQARRFRAEIKLARKVRHRNVCAVHEYGEDGQLSYIAMEYVEGTDLKQELRRRGRIPPEEGFDIAVQCAAGLQAIHEVGIIHRDLKTPNIMRDTRAQVRLMDFGIAKESAAKASTAAGKIVGTPDYMSPEQARGERLDFRSDLYSLGIVVFEIFTGNRPFSSDSPVALIRMQIENDPPLDALIARGLPPSLRPVLKKLLAKQPDERFASAEELMRAFKDAEASWRANDPPSDTRHVSAGALALEPQPTPITAAPIATPEPPPTSETFASPGEAVPDLQVVGSGGLRVAKGELEAEHPLPPTDPQRHSEVDQQRSHEQAILQLKGEAETLAAEGRLEDAQRILHEALLFEPGRPDLQEALVRLGERQARQVEERRALVVAQVAAAAHALIDSGELAAARTELVRASRQLGSHEALRAVETRLRRQEEEAWRQTSELPAWQRQEGEQLASPPAVRPALGVWIAGVTALVLLAGVGLTLRALLGEPAQHPAPAEGMLQVVVQPWAEVSVDGVLVGITPLDRITSREGARVIRLAHPAFLPLERTVTVRTGELTELVVDLSREGTRK